MTVDQLWKRFDGALYELDTPPATRADWARHKAIPSELRAISRELRMRGTQLTLQIGPL
jgi:hypothetical protein